MIFTPCFAFHILLFVICCFYSVLKRGVQTYTKKLYLGTFWSIILVYRFTSGQVSKLCFYHKQRVYLSIRSRKAGKLSRTDGIKVQVYVSISVIYKDLKVKESTEFTKKEEEHIDTPLYFFFYLNSAAQFLVRTPSAWETKSSKHLDMSEFSPILVQQT